MLKFFDINHWIYVKTFIENKNNEVKKFNELLSKNKIESIVLANLLSLNYNCNIGNKELLRIKSVLNSDIIFFSFIFLHFMDNYLCFDLGTTKIKSSLLDENGRIIYFSSIDAKTYYDDGIYQKPEEYFNTVVNEIKIIKKKHYDEFKKAKAFICSGQMGGVMGIDESWNAVFPWTYSVDSRFNTYVDRI